MLHFLFVAIFTYLLWKKRSENKKKHKACYTRRSMIMHVTTQLLAIADETSFCLEIYAFVKKPIWHEQWGIFERLILTSKNEKRNIEHFQDLNSSLLLLFSERLTCIIDYYSNLSTYGFSENCFY